MGGCLLRLSIHRLDDSGDLTEENKADIVSQVLLLLLVDRFICGFFEILFLPGGFFLSF